MIYIDLNMVRAGVVAHPCEWEACGYQEIHNPKQRYGVPDHQRLRRLLGIRSSEDAKVVHRKWIENVLKDGLSTREAHWT